MTLTLSRIWVKTQRDLQSHKCVRLRTCFSLETTANKLPVNQNPISSLLSMNGHGQILIGSQGAGKQKGETAEM